MNEILKEKLLAIMDRKDHWAWSTFSGSQITRDQLKIHFQQEYAVYIRDFPIFLARVLGKNPPMKVRRDLAENLYEEETGGLTLGRPHPELFLLLMEGLRFKTDDFLRVRLLPSSRRYRHWLDQITLKGTWIEGAAVTTIFVEGSIHDRKELDSPSHSNSMDIEEKLLSHPLVRYHGVDPRYMELARAHEAVEGSHRKSAWKMVLTHAESAAEQDRVVRVLNRSLRLWLAYRDGIARACRLKPNPENV